MDDSKFFLEDNSEYARGKKDPLKRLQEMESELYRKHAPKVKEQKKYQTESIKNAPSKPQYKPKKRDPLNKGGSLPPKKLKYGLPLEYKSNIRYTARAKRFLEILKLPVGGIIEELAKQYEKQFPQAFLDIYTVDRGYPLPPQI